MFDTYILRVHYVLSKFDDELIWCSLVKFMIKFTMWEKFISIPKIWRNNTYFFYNYDEVMNLIYLS